MARIGTLREAFDRDMDFEAVRPLKFNGREFRPGQLVDKSLVNTRKLRQLYDTRYLKMVEPVQPQQVLEPPEEPKPQFEIGNMVPPELPKPKKVERVKLDK